MSKSNHLLKVFLCHSSQDKPSVRELAQRLSDEGWIDPWLDEKKLLPGQDWRLKIEEAVEISDIVIICLSSNSVSKEGFVQKELRYAREISLEKLEESIFLIPLRIDECNVPRGLRFYQWADYFGEKKDETYNALLESLRLRYEQKLKFEREEYALREKERLEREATEKAAREKAERKLVERIAIEKAEREAAEKIKREKAEREAAQKVARETAKRELAEKSKHDKEERRVARKAELEKSISKSFTSLKSSITGAKPFFSIAGVAGIIIIFLWAGSLAMPKLRSLFPTTSPSATKTKAETPTSTKVLVQSAATALQAFQQPTTTKAKQMKVFTCEVGGNMEVCKSEPDGSNQINLTNNLAIDTTQDRFVSEGEKIVFESNRFDVPINTYMYDIFVMNSDGTQQTQLTYNNGNDLLATISPDNKKVLFLCWRDGNGEVYVINIDGSGQTNLSNNPAFDQPSFWLPDGRIVFVSDRDNGKVNAYVMNADGSNQIPYIQ